MPTFFFHLIRDGCRIEDGEGLDLPDVTAAFTEALRSAENFVREAVRQGERYPAHLEVTDKAGKLLLTAALPWPDLH